MNFHLVIYLVRDDVVSPQKFDAMVVVDTNYHHHSILSDNINELGEHQLNAGGLADENTVIYNDFTYELPDPSLHPTYNIEQPFINCLFMR